MESLDWIIHLDYIVIIIISIYSHFDILYEISLILTLKINFSVVSGYEREFKLKIFFLWRLLGLSLEPLFWKGERGYKCTCITIMYRSDIGMIKQ